ncbi:MULTISPECIES: efflux RND transporter periplasmic adaptor subunit [Legionella]|uniref:HlyD family transporter secretion protein n=1 Tax=Legionella drozanskii LLAP-1 TaxID=1212489 RepID=A0A0W0SQD0_9GAMM|nr:MULTISPECIES: efflux RND transporter periplasmic adaptor subunit [Legionella]KTC85592.1 HlyD family transporter secretion protein [Legionella drozanskii LLAP-1]PJE15810.1 MAG: efflux RND transporter periplasmic adaptor subunit [Legionella sp.]
MTIRILKGVKSTKLALCCVIYSLLVSCEEHKPAASLPILTVPVIEVKTSTIPITKQYIGITQSISSVDIRARVEGFLVKKNFTEGKFVKKNQLIYVIDPAPFQAKLDSARGELARSIASQEYQQVQYLRLKQLVAQGNVSKSQYDEVIARYHEAMAQVDVNKAQLETAKINLGYCYMYSPDDGIISHRYVDVGNLVGGAEQTLLANVVKLDPIYIEFSPSISDFDEIIKYRVHMPFHAEATLPHGKSVMLKGLVDFVNNAADTPTSTILMRATLANPEKLIRPGIYMNVKVILTKNGEAVLLPGEAILETQGKRSVYTVNKENKVVNKAISISGQYGNQYIVKSGLQAGDLVITRGMQKIKPGQEVKIAKSAN